MTARPPNKRGANKMTTTHKRENARGSYEILVAEDSPTQAEHLARVLAHDPDCPARVRVAADGEAALQMARDMAPDLVVSDIAMPRMDGYALCRALKDDAALAAVPVLLLTRLTTLQDIVRSLEAGADGFLPKPYDAGQLRVVLQRAAQRIPVHARHGDVADDQVGARRAGHGQRGFAVGGHAHARRASGILRQQPGHVRGLGGAVLDHEDVVWRHGLFSLVRCCHLVRVTKAIRAGAAHTPAFGTCIDIS